MFKLNWVSHGNIIKESLGKKLYNGIQESEKSTGIPPVCWRNDSETVVGVRDQDSWKKMEAYVQQWTEIHLIVIAIVKHLWNK